MIPAFPKILALGQVYIKNILDGQIEVTEKVDGSAFSFGRLGDSIYMRSKRSMIYSGTEDKMFNTACTYVRGIQERLPDGKIFHAEYLSKPKHNAIKYGRVPLNNLALYGIRNVSDGSYESDYVNLQSWADRLEIDAVPLIYLGQLATMTAVAGLIDRESYLGGSKIEGIVVKNYERSMNIGELVFPIMCGKYVSEEYKERSGDWKKDHTNIGQWEGYKLAYRTEARWMKAIQHLRDDGLLQGAPQDIGPLIKEVQRDITEECEQDIRDFLWKHFGKEILRVASHGLPEFYKNYLMEGNHE